AEHRRAVRGDRVHRVASHTRDRRAHRARRATIVGGGVGRGARARALRRGARRWTRARVFRRTVPAFVPVRGGADGSDVARRSGDAARRAVARRELDTGATGGAGESGGGATGRVRRDCSRTVKELTE